MGSGNWSTLSYSCLATERDYKCASKASVFTNSVASASNTTTSFNVNARTYNTNIDEKMLNVGVRECRDSDEHPDVTPIIIAFDVTGSMGSIPHKMVTEQLPKLMDYLKQIGVKDPQLLFMAIGDHECDRYPIQVGQFESDTKKIVDSLQSMYLEGGGGGNDGESYLLAWIMAGYHTETDSFYKRGKKGFLFTIGDEPNLKSVPEDALVQHLKYEKGCKEITAEEALNKAREQYHVYHIHVNDGYRRFDENWKQVMGDGILRASSSELNEVIGKKIHEVLGDGEPEEKKTEEKKDADYQY